MIFGAADLLSLIQRAPHTKKNSAIAVATEFANQFCMCETTACCFFSFSHQYRTAAHEDQETSLQRNNNNNPADFSR